MSRDESNRKGYNAPGRGRHKGKSLLTVEPEAAAVPEGARVRARYAYKLSDWEPQYSEGKPGQVSPHFLLSEIVLPAGVKFEHQQDDPCRTAKA